MSEHQDAVETLALEYLAGVESGAPPDLDALAEQLPTEEQRKELRALCRAASLARDALPEALRAGMRVAGRFVLLEELGSGSYGKVFCAFDEHNERKVALKVFHALRDEHKLAADLERERKALATLQHDGIVRLLDHGRHDGTIFLALEYEQGRSLDRVLQTLAQQGQYPPTRDAVVSALGGSESQGPLRIEDTWHRTCARIAIGMLWALEAAHTHQPRILHRDLKPSNVLLRHDARPVLLDFGLAGIGEGEGDVTARLFGSAPYMAPEQILKGKTGKHEASDLYQLGLLLYEMLTLQRAFAGEDRSEVLHRVQTNTFKRPSQVRPDIPDELEDICMRALEHNPDRRYPSAGAFRTDLERWLDGLVPTASRLGSIGRVVRSGRRFLWRNRVAAALVATLVGGFAANAAFSPTPLHAKERVVDQARVEIGIDTDEPRTLWRRYRDGDLLRLVPLAVVVEGEPRYPFLLPRGRHVIEVAQSSRDLLAADADIYSVVHSFDPPDRLQRWCEDLMRMLAARARIGEPYGFTRAELDKSSRATRGPDAPPNIDLQGLQALLDDKD